MALSLHTMLTCTHIHTHVHADYNYKQTKPDTEFSELVLYEVQVMMEGDMHEAALKHMNSFESSICDTGCLFENKGML